MAVLRFDGTDDWVRGNTSGAWNGAFTVAVLLNSNDPVAAGCMFGTHTATAIAWEFYTNTAQSVRYWNQAAGVDSLGPTINITDDYILALTRASGTTTPRFHVKNLTTAAAWAHSAGSLAAANPSSAAGSYFKAGDIDNVPGDPGAGDEPWPGDMGLFGFWDGVDMSDGQCEALSTNSKTSDWHNHAAGEPTLLAELNTLTPADIGSAAISLAVTGCALTGTEMVGWTFDGTGTPAGPAAETLHVAYGPLLRG